MSIYTLNPTVQMAPIKALEKNTVKYPMRSVDCKVFSIPAGAPIQHAREHVPRHPAETSGGVLHLVVCCTVSRQEQQHQLPRRVRGRATDTLQTSLNRISTTTSSSIATWTCFSSTGKMWQDEGNGHCLAATSDTATPSSGFDLTPDACDGACFHLVQKGNVRIEIHFRDALPTIVNVFAYAEFVLEIDKSRKHHLRLLRWTPCRSPDYWRLTRAPDRYFTECRTQRQTAYDDRRFTCGLRVQHRRRWRTGRSIGPALYLDVDGGGDYFCSYGLPPRHATFRTSWTNIVPSGLIIAADFRVLCLMFADNIV